jgi:hypothetical protein
MEQAGLVPGKGLFLIDDTFLLHSHMVEGQGSSVESLL